MIETITGVTDLAERKEGIDMKKRWYGLWIALLIVLSLLALGQHTAASEREDGARTTLNAEALALVSRARINLMRRLDVDANRIALQSVEPAEFPDPSLGVLEPNKAIPLVATQGYSIQLKEGNVIYRYWAANGRLVYIGSYVQPTLDGSTVTGMTNAGREGRLPKLSK
jgi:hypothetical protein